MRVGNPDRRLCKWKALDFAYIYIYMLPGLVDLKNTKIQASFFSGDETMAQGTVGQAGTVYPSELPYTIR